MDPAERRAVVFLEEPPALRVTVKVRPRLGPAATASLKSLLTDRRGGRAEEALQAIEPHGARDDVTTALSGEPP